MEFKALIDSLPFSARRDMAARALSERSSEPLAHLIHPEDLLEAAKPEPARLNQLGELGAGACALQERLIGPLEMVLLPKISGGMTAAENLAAETPLWPCARETGAILWDLAQKAALLAPDAKARQLFLSAFCAAMAPCALTRGRINTHNSRSPLRSMAPEPVWMLFFERILGTEHSSNTSIFDLANSMSHFSGILFDRQSHEKFPFWDELRDIARLGSADTDSQSFSWLVSALGQTQKPNGALSVLALWRFFCEHTPNSPEAPLSHNQERKEFSLRQASAVFLKNRAAGAHALAQDSFLRRCAQDQPSFPEPVWLRAARDHLLGFVGCAPEDNHPTAAGAPLFIPLLAKTMDFPKERLSMGDNGQPWVEISHSCLQLSWMPEALPLFLWAQETLMPKNEGAAPYPHPGAERALSRIPQTKSFAILSPDEPIALRALLSSNLTLGKNILPWINAQPLRDEARRLRLIAACFLCSDLEAAQSILAPGDFERLREAHPLLLSACSHDKLLMPTLARRFASLEECQAQALACAQLLAEEGFLSRKKAKATSEQTSAMASLIEQAQLRRATAGSKAPETAQTPTRARL